MEEYLKNYVLHLSREKKTDYPHHNSYINIDEKDVLSKGVEIYVQSEFHLFNFY